MANQLSSAKVQKWLIGTMTYEKYTIDDMYSMYSELMDMDEYTVYRKMSRTSLAARMGDWAKVHNSWIVKEGNGAEARYFRRYIKRCCLCKLDFKRRVNKALRKLKR